MCLLTPLSILFAPTLARDCTSKSPYDLMGHQQRSCHALLAAATSRCHISLAGLPRSHWCCGNQLCSSCHGCSTCICMRACQAPTAATPQSLRRASPRRRVYQPRSGMCQGRAAMQHQLHAAGQWHRLAY
ncbi:hypothetical protein COO60DRAFT_1480003 [Scenedesmus sp. NREL 46B-D3]|nr:hypothetical protein COO60DRAFT_1480003 [Scenedesmus sp. NREL 46B-D3]